MLNKRLLAFAGGALLLSTGIALAGYYDSLPTIGSLAPTFQIPMDTEYAQGRQPQTVRGSLSQIDSAQRQDAGSGGWRNALIGGDFGTNLWQRGTTGAATTGSVVYEADRFFTFSGTGTEIKAIKETAAADITQGYIASARIQRTASQTGVIASCFGQVLSSQNSTRFQGQVAEFEFHAKTGANFSAAGSIVTGYIITGTGSDDTAANLVAGSWAGQANAAATPVTLTTSWDRYSVVGTIPAAATQIGVEICFTPVGTAGANDWFETTGLQLDVNSNAVARTNSSQVAGQYSYASFERRPANVEAQMQFAYYYQLNDPAATVRIGPCQVISANTTARCLVPLPAPMRAAPTITAPGAHTTFAITAADGSANVCTALSATTSATTLAQGSQISVDCTPTSNIAVTVPSQLIGDAQSFSISASAEF